MSHRWLVQVARWVSSFRPAVWVAVLVLVSFCAAQEIARKVVARTAPTYPEMARKMHLEGKVRVEVVITPAGNVASAKLVGGSPVFEKSALEAVKQWRFAPADKETRGTIVVEFAGR